LMETTDDAEEADTDEEDVFFDCDNDDDKDAIPVWSKDPVGRLKRLGKSKLLHHDDYLYVPMCQDPTPMTEDMLAEQAEILLQLGMDAQGAQLRAQMQSASLLSDMESFKAANPGSVLADFVRWHSPRDWDKDKGQLSARMEAAGNIWKEAWENAKPVPAKRQKRLFDDTREAEKALQYLNNLRPSEAAHMLMPVLQHVAVSRLSQEISETISGNCAV
jgi:Rab3 GTPase-activating protein catalytic subunit